MKLVIVLLTLTAVAADVTDLSGKMLTFPAETNTARVVLKTTKQNFNAVTVCHRSFTDLKRDHGLFSLSTPAFSNDFLIFWDFANKEIDTIIKDKKVRHAGKDYKLNTWHSICTTWDSQTGLVQLWFDGEPSVRKFVISGSNISGSTHIILGQEQDSHGGGFDSRQSFVGMMSDVHMWDYTLSACEMQSYVDELNFTPGNVLNWRALDFEIIDNVLIENKFGICH